MTCMKRPPLSTHNAGDNCEGKYGLSTRLGLATKLFTFEPGGKGPSSTGFAAL